MKANQAFKANDEAVSPVIGVILMVAITVVLAAVVFVLVSNLSENANTSNPQVAFTSDEQGATAGGVLTVVSITNGPLDLNKIMVSGTAVSTSAQAANCKFNGADLVLSAGTAGLPPATSWVLPGGTADLKAGDQISCTAVSSAGSGVGTITVSYFEPSALLYSGSFA